MKFIYFCLVAISGQNLFADAMHNGAFYGVGDVPYMAQLQLEYENGMVTYCGATIISEYWLVSAAHCIGKENVTVYKARVGSTSTLDNGKLINITQAIIHGNYDTNHVWDNDISLIKLETPIEFDELRQPIRIARESPKVGDSITISGFGLEHYGVSIESLKIGHVPVIDDDTCRLNYTITENMFCTSTNKIDLCFGDSGGPGVFDGKLVGVVSQGCEYTAPNVFIKVANYYDWILKTTGVKYHD